MVWSFEDVAEARRIVESLLGAIPLSDYGFNVEADDGGWDVHIEYSGPEGWQTKTLRVDGRLLRDTREDESARDQLLDTWRDELLGAAPEDRGSSG